MFELLKNKFTTFAKIWKWIGAEIWGMEIRFIWLDFSFEEKREDSRFIWTLKELKSSTFLNGVQIHHWFELAVNNILWCLDYEIILGFEWCGQTANTLWIWLFYARKDFVEFFEALKMLFFKSCLVEILELVLRFGDRFNMI
jgi:hypothetical protein